MSHHPVPCAPDGHAFSAWTTEDVITVSGERGFELQRRCFLCGLVETERAMITEDP
jgi:hypothetical protein